MSQPEKLAVDIYFYTMSAAVGEVPRVPAVHLQRMDFAVVSKHHYIVVFGGAVDVRLDHLMWSRLLRSMCTQLSYSCSVGGAYWQLLW